MITRKAPTALTQGYPFRAMAFIAIVCLAHTVRNQAIGIARDCFMLFGKFEHNLNISMVRKSASCFALRMAIAAAFLTETCAAQTCVSPPPGLLAWWTGDNDATDLVGANDGVLANGALAGVAGNVGGAFSFDGVDDFVTVANESQFDFEWTDAFSIDLWFNTSSNDVANIVSKQSASGARAGFQLIKHRSIGGQFGVSFGNRLYFFLNHDVPGNNRIRVAASTGVADGLWHHVVVTYDGSASATGVRIFLDGVEETTRVTHDTLSGSIQNDLPLQISGRDGANSVFNGLIDEVRILDRALSLTEIQAIHNAGAAGVCKALPTIENLAMQVALLNLANGINNALDTKLDSALNALDDVNENNDVAACNSLWAFINHVEAQSGKKISVEDADYLIDYATEIILLICSP